MYRELFVPTLTLSLLALQASSAFGQGESYRTVPSDIAALLMESKQPDISQKLPAVFTPVLEKDGKTIRYEIDVQEIKRPKNLLKNGEDGAHNTNPRTKAIYKLGGDNWTTYYYMEFELPDYLTDADGGTIRLIMQHEVDAVDQLRMIDEHIATEYNSDYYGRRGRYTGRYGWTRQSGGGNSSWILGDRTAHNIATPWGWAWIMDYKWLQGNGVLGGDKIRIYSHPHVTTRVIMMD